ncbi:MAG: SDR family NAD(P)-dependent oxidoreductase [Bacillota bacterium]
MSMDGLFGQAIPLAALSASQQVEPQPARGPGFDLSGRVAVVTGVGHGFGRAICGVLGQSGATVYGCDLDETELAETALLTGARTARVDVTDEAAVARFVGQVVADAGRIDILVNNAGGVAGQVGRPVEEVSTADFNRVLEVNLHGAFYCIRAAAPYMKERRYGRIVNIASGAGRTYSLTGIQAYTSAKHALIGLTRQEAVELGPYGITVNAVAPGFVLSNPSTLRQWEAMGPAGQRALIESLALRCLGSPEDVANAVLFFASDLARWVTGQVLSVDGGRAIF